MPQAFRHSSGFCHSQHLPPSSKICSCKLQLLNISLGKCTFTPICFLSLLFSLLPLIFFFQVQASLLTVPYNLAYLWGVLRYFPSVFYSHSFSPTLHWNDFSFSSKCLCWIISFPFSVSPLSSEELLTVKFTVLILWLIFAMQARSWCYFVSVT